MSLLLSRRTIILFCNLLVLYGAQGATTYYVNDGSLVGDVYCSAIGNNANAGTAAAPFATVNYVIGAKVLGPGDIIYVDTGNYSDQWMFNSNADGGSAATNLSLIGAGNTKSKLVYAAASPAVYLGDGTNPGNSYITIQNMYIETTSNGVNTVQVNTNTSHITLQTCSLTVVGASCFQPYKANYMSAINCILITNKDGIRTNYCGNHTFSGNTIVMSAKTGNNCGIFIEGLSTQGLCDNCVIKNNRISGGSYGVDMQNEGTGNLWQNNYIYGCDYGMWGDNSAESHITNTFRFNSIYSVKECFKGDFNSWTIINNIFYTTSSNGAEYCIKFNNATDNPTTLDYNVYYHPNGALCAYRNTVTYSALVANWRNVFNSDEVNGKEADPIYAAPASGNLNTSPSSPGDDAAYSVAAVTDDVRGSVVTRPATNQDIGAFQNDVWALPVELLTFTCSPFVSGNLLEWATASETNNAYFLVERSQDGIHFNPIYRAKGAGNSSRVLDYSFSDPYPFSTYYRLTQIDFDGKSFVSPILFADRSKNPVSILPVAFPNPVTGNSFFIQLDKGHYRCNFKVEISDVLGRIVSAAEMDFNHESPSVQEINAADLLPGYYTLSVKNAFSVVSSKFLKQ